MSAKLQLPVAAGRLPGCVGRAPIASTVSALDRLRQSTNLGVTTIAATRDRTPPGGGSATAVVGDLAELAPESYERGVLCGRAVERFVVGRLLARVRAGRGAVLVIRGEAGIGKSALLDHAAAAAPAEAAPPGTAAVRVLRGAGVPSEAELPFAGLHLLLGSALDRRSVLPQPQQDALSAAFGLRRAGSDDRFLIGLAVRSLLAELAQDGPLVCLVDDAQWLDRTSAEALVFAARRLDAEPIAVFFAARDHDAPFAAPGLPELQLGGLDTVSSAALLAEHGGAELPPEARERILAQAQGNPLGLIELAAAYLHTPAVAWPGPGALALTDRLQQAFAGQVRRLPEPTQTLLLAAAAEDSGDLGVVGQAARALGVVLADVGAAERAGLVRISDDTIRFRHPLVRAVVYQGAPLDRRLAVHRALAGALPGAADAGRRAWHLAAAATGPDEQVAAELERTAATAKARGGYAAAAAASQRAVQLTADPAARARRLALAAEAAGEVGEFDRACDLAVRAAGQTADPTLQARLASVRALAAFVKGRLPTAHRLLVDGAVGIDGSDRPRAVRMLMRALQVAWFVGDWVLVADTAERLNAMGGSHAQPLVPLVRLLLWSTAQADERPVEGLPRLAELVAAATSARADDGDDLAMVATVCLVTGRNADARELLAALVADAREQGRIGRLPALLTCLAQALVLDGRHRDALASASEALRLAHDTGQVQWTIQATAIMAYLAAVDGDEARCRGLADAALAEPATHTAVAGTPWAGRALGLLELGLGHLDTALVQLERIFQGPLRYHGSALRSVPDLVEAAVRLGQPQRAAEPLARFCQWARRADTPATDALVERCHALLDIDGDAERHYLAALKLHQASFEQARTQLLYGAWLRRARRKADARTQLRVAVDYLDRIHATPWAERARAELGAAGTTTPQPDRTGRPWLTPQELQVARRAAQGLSNRDIAVQLFLSPRTVGYHLYKAYPKLGVTSRNELDPATLGA
jgi:DNA-binding CsgD family transcriptional regulator/tetratricopeptide (TPR) repeat protein